jgi:hypothetical protein
MVESNNKNKDWGLFIIIFTIIFGSLYGLFRVGKTLTERSKETDKLIEIIRECKKNGMTDDQILQVCYDSASQQFKRGLTESEKKSVKVAFLKAKSKIN